MEDVAFQLNDYYFDILSILKGDHVIVLTENVSVMMACGQDLAKTTDELIETI